MPEDNCTDANPCEHCQDVAGAVPRPPPVPVPVAEVTKKWLHPDGKECQNYGLCLLPNHVQVEFAVSAPTPVAEVSPKRWRHADGTTCADLQSCRRSHGSVFSIRPPELTTGPGPATESTIDPGGIDPRAFMTPAPTAPVHVPEVKRHQRLIDGLTEAAEAAFAKAAATFNPSPAAPARASDSEILCEVADTLEYRLRGTDPYKRVGMDHQRIPELRRIADRLMGLKDDVAASAAMNTNTEAVRLLNENRELKEQVGHEHEMWELAAERCRLAEERLFVLTGKYDALNKERLDPSARLLWDLAKLLVGKAGNEPLR